MLSTTKGSLAERSAVCYIRSKKYMVLETNWRRKDCEIDIVAFLRQTQTLHFFEVKYRQSSDFGEGVDYITKQKAKRLIKAAQRYIFEKRLDCAIEIGVVSVCGDDYRVDRFIERLDLL